MANYNPQKDAVDAALKLARRNFGTLPNNFGPLHALASTQADPRVVAVALEAGGDVDAQDGDGMTALMYAAKDLQGDIASHLVAAGANKELTNNEGKTARALFDEALAADQAIAEENGESPTVDPNVAEDIRKTFEGGRRRRNRKTRARKTKRRLTRRRK